MIYFQNDSEIDLEAITTLGINVKESDNPIGYFGTGLKYAIAVLLRQEGSISIFSGLHEYAFTIRDHEVRGKTFAIVYCNGERLGFTTEFGKNWVMWQAFREVYCNTLDEGGVVDDQRLAPVEGKTTVVVNHPEFDSAYRMKDRIVLETKPIYSTPGLEVHRGSNDHVFYRGVRIHKLDTPSMFTYNVKHDVTLTEDRTAKYVWAVMDPIKSFMVKCDDAILLRSVLMAPETFMENDMTVSGEEPSDTFMSVCEDLCLRQIRFNEAAKLHYLTQLKLEAVYEEFELNAVEQAQYAKAVRICETIDANPSYHEVKFVKSLGGRTCGQALRDTNTILIAKQAFRQGTKFVVSTLYEECIHLEQGYDDFTREFQEHILDQMLTLIETHVLKEPM